MLEKGQAWSTLVFIEVRQRQRSGFGDAALSVTKSKQHKIIKAARYFLQQHPEYNDFEYRFDVIAYDTNVNTSASHKNKSSEVKETTSKNTQPEWLQGAFIASAW
jgi:putative endonuclease